MIRQPGGPLQGNPAATRAESDVLLLFVKRPVPGKVKTRLARRLGQREASRLYARMAEGAWARTAAGPFSRWLVYAPPGDGDFFERWLPGADRYLAQSEGDLGDRMEAAINEAFDADAGRVAVAGTDLPDLDAAVAMRAFDLLEPGGAVLCPAFDGGFWLVALAEPARDLFRGVDWAASDVYEQARRRLQSLGYRTCEGPRLRDVDTIEDLEAFPALTKSIEPS